jgi:hypothetical protein
VKPWTVDQFFEWQMRQTERYELVSGFPVRMVVGARNVHDDIVVGPTKNGNVALCGSDTQTNKKSTAGRDWSRLMAYEEHESFPTLLRPSGRLRH